MDQNPASIVSSIADVRILAQECKAINDRINRSERDTMSEYRELGKRLTAVKGFLKHGEYGPWLDKNGIPTQRASKAARVHEHWGKFPGAGNLEEFLTACADIKLCSDPPPPISIISTDADTSEEDEPATETAPLPVTGRGSKPPAKPPAKPPDTPAEPPAPVYPDRIKPHMEAAPLFKDAAQKAVRLANVLRDAEKTAAYKAVHEGQEVVVYSSTVQLIATNYEHDMPVCACPEGCANFEPNMDADPCPKCGGKGYQTQDDIENAA